MLQSTIAAKDPRSSAWADFPAQTRRAVFGRDGRDPARVCMYTPSAGGGHAQYTAELLAAMTRHPRGGPRFELVSSRDLEPSFRTGTYPVNAVLPELAPRSAFKSTIAWAASRWTHYAGRDGLFLKWLASRPDLSIVHLQEYFPWRPSPLFRGIRRLKKKVFYTVHNIYPHSYPPLMSRRFWDRRNRVAWRLADGLFVHTTQLAEQLSKFMDGQHPPIRVVPHGVWTRTDSLPTPPLQQRLQWKRLLFFGSIRRNKGLDLLLDAAASLPGFSLTIAGAPLEREYFQTEVYPRVQQLKSQGVAIELMNRFIPDDEAAELFATHSAIVLPYTEQFASQSGVVFMALAHELPVIASEVGGLRDLFERYRIGVSIAEPSADTIAAAVQALFSGAEHEQLLRELQSAKEHYSWDSAAGATIDGYVACTEASRDR